MKKSILIILSVFLLQSCDNTDVLSKEEKEIDLSNQWIMDDNTISCSQGNAFGTLIIEFNKNTNKVALSASDGTNLPVSDSNYSLKGNNLSFLVISKLNFNCENTLQNIKTITLNFDGVFNGTSFDGDYLWNETLENNFCAQPNTCNGNIQLYQN